jgi:hypothetical protein
MSATCPQFTMSVDRPDMSDELEAARCFVVLVTSPETPEGAHKPPTLYGEEPNSVPPEPGNVTVVESNP